jgi:FkbM family methyltransferase
MSNSQRDVEPFGSYAPGGSLKVVIQLARLWSGSGGLKQLSSLMRKIALAFIGQSPVDFEFHGGYARFRPNGNTAEKRALLNPARFDPEELAFIAEELPKGGVFLDIGANAGLYSLVAAQRAGREGRVLAFEPNPPVFERLQANVVLNQSSGGAKIEPIQNAVSDSGTTLRFLHPGRNLGEGRVLDSEDRDVDGDVIEVAGVLLLNALTARDISRVDIVKIDIEGHEKFALEPFFREAPASLLPQAIIVERGEEDHWNELQSLFAQYGYISFKACRMNEIMCLAGN